jgi:exodeoxyribonuclease VII small subunit
MVGAAAERIDDSESFEAVYERLEQAVARLEDGGLGLEESIALYETGMRLARRCKELLDAAELRISQLDADLGPDALSLDEDGGTGGPQ